MEESDSCPCFNNYLTISTHLKKLHQEKQTESTLFDSLVASYYTGVWLT